jgi:adenylosuccinate lyase
MLVRMGKILAGLVVKADRMRANIDMLRGLPFSGQVLLRLVDAGLTREEAYDAVQSAAMRTWHGGAAFADELLAEPAVSAHITRRQLDEWFTLEPYMAHVPAIFRRCGVEL